jgi:methyltransferase domain protein
LKEYAGNDAAADLITGQRYEESLYNKYKEYYGYVFYIGQKKD